VLGLLAISLLAWAQQQPTAVPFELTLPSGFEEFTQNADGMSVWTAPRSDGVAKFEVSHYVLGSFGANAKAIAESYRQNHWLPLLGEREHNFVPWQGKLDGFQAEGWEITYQQGNAEMMVLQRLTIQGDRMTMVLWEGMAAAAEDTRARLDAFRMPLEWVPEPPPEVDIYAGLGANGTAAIFPGSFHLEVRVPPAEIAAQIEVDITYVPGLSPVASGEFQWQLPQFAEVMPIEEDLGGRRIRYRLPLSEDGSNGLTRINKDSFSALDSLWVAVPTFLLDSKSGFEPPAWTLRVIHPPHLLSLGTTQMAVDYSKELNANITDFVPMPAGRAWPFFMVGAYKKEQTSGLNWHLRLDSKSKLTHDTVRELMRLRPVLDRWLPGSSEDWSVASFPYIGDRVLPNLLVLDEEQGWFQSPVDAPMNGLARRVALARLLCQQRFGSRLHGLGSAKFFLDASLAEYATWRLLSLSDNQADADALVAHWKLAEQYAGKLPMPVSLLDSSDLFGPRRLLSFGPLVWMAIEKRCGRTAFDAMLQDLLQQPRSWTTADLEEELNHRQPEVDWTTFMRQHVYGRTLPAND
jgi:hypothetical protein